MIGQVHKFNYEPMGVEELDVVLLRGLGPCGTCADLD